ncbi:MAG: T9SS type A sorting domain-containing protein [Saprospiraceae bacterium]
MKSLFTLLLLALMITSGFAQDLSLSETAMTIGSAEEIKNGDLVLTNNSTTESVEVAIRLERVCLNDADETEIQVCIGVLCFSSTNATTTWGEDSGTAFMTLEPGQTDDQFAFKALPAGAHESEWNLVLFDRNNPSNEVAVNIKIEGGNLLGCINTSTTDFNYEIGKAYPNPASESINIPYQIDANDANLNIYTSTGQLVKSVAVTPQAEQAEVNISEFVSGVYFYNITDGKEQSKMMSFVK